LARAFDGFEAPPAAWTRGAPSPAITLTIGTFFSILSGKRGVRSCRDEVWMRSVASTASSIAYGGLSAASARAARSAYKLANVHVQRFQEPAELPQEAPQAGAPSYPTALGESLRAHNFQGQSAGSNTDLAFEAIEQISAVNAFRANVAMLQAADERYGSLLDIRV
jgi:flagellar basal body rod protein FlgC